MTINIKSLPTVSDDELLAIAAFFESAPATPYNATMYNLIDIEIERRTS